MRSLIFCQLAVLTALTATVVAKETFKPTAPVALQAINGAAGAGAVKLVWQPVKGATEYVVASSRETEKSWQSVATTTSPSYEFAELPEGTTYYFRVACNTKSGQGPWSSSVALNTTPNKGAMAALQRSASLSVRTQTP